MYFNDILRFIQYCNIKYRHKSDCICYILLLARIENLSFETFSKACFLKCNQFILLNNLTIFFITSLQEDCNYCRQGKVAYNAITDSFYS